MPEITTIKEYSRGHKTFPIGTKISVTWEKAYEMEKAGICVLPGNTAPKAIKEETKTETKSKKVKKDGGTK
jgi:hypothetical protein